MPERLGRVDVSQPSDHPLVEKHRLDRGASLRERGVKRLRGQRWIVRLGSESELDGGVVGMQLQRAERAGVVEHDARTVIERQRGAREARKAVVRAVDGPVAGHAKVCVQHPSVIEMDELVLAAAFDGADAGATERAQACRRNAPLQCRVKHLGTDDRVADERGAQAANRTFDLGELGHSKNLWPERGSVCSRALTRAPRSGHVGGVTTSTHSAAARRRSARATASPAVRSVLVVVLVLNALVAIVKVFVGARTGALTVLGAALESGLDMLNNVFGIMLVGVAGRAPDEDHPYGHDKFETLGAIGIVGFLSISCFELLREGVVALMAQTRPHSVSLIDVIVIAATLAVNFFVVAYERRRARELGSAFLMADASHTASDILVTLMALAALALASAGWARLDALLAIAVALIIARSGAVILRGSIPILVDERAIDAGRIRGVVLGVPQIRDVRTVRSRSTASGQLFAEVTIAVSGETPVDEAHRLADAVEAAIEREFGTSQVTVHVEPA